MPPMKPDVCSLPNGRIGLFIGADYKFLTRDAAEALRDALTAELSKPLQMAPEVVTLHD